MDFGLTVAWLLSLVRKQKSWMDKAPNQSACQCLVFCAYNLNRPPFFYSSTVIWDAASLNPLTSTAKSPSTTLTFTALSARVRLARCGSSSTNDQKNSMLSSISTKPVASDRRPSRILSKNAGSSKRFVPWWLPTPFTQCPLID